MRILRPAILTAAVGVALLCGVAPAQASGQTAQGLPSVSVSPGTARPGESVSITATCSKSTTTRSLVVSNAFDPVTVEAVTSRSVLTGTITINHVRPGRYTVTSTCDDGATTSTMLTIVSASVVVPTGGARTGGGSTASGQSGLSAPMTVAGVVLLAAGVGLVAVNLRRRAARR